MVGLASGAAIDIETDAELLKGVLDHLVVAVDHLLGSDALLTGTLSDGHAMFVASANEHHVLAFQAEVAYIYIGRHVDACEVAYVHTTIGIGQS